MEEEEEEEEEEGNPCFYFSSQTTTVETKTNLKQKLSDGCCERQNSGGGHNSSGLSIPAGGRSGSHGLNQSLDGTDGEEEDQLPPESHRLFIGSLPAHLSPHLLGGCHCPICSKFLAADEIEKHLLMCFSKTRLTYNKDILSRDSGECTICLEELEQGDTIARLPCLCIYHK
ncbi:hypothetical protein LDENG_00069480, partial [Lucifuga dentata]